MRSNDHQDVPDMIAPQRQSAILPVKTVGSMQQSRATQDRQLKPIRGTRWTQNSWIPAFGLSLEVCLFRYFAAWSAVEKRLRELPTSAIHGSYHVTSIACQAWQGQVSRAPRSRPAAPAATTSIESTTRRFALPVFVTLTIAYAQWKVVKWRRLWS